MEFKSPVFPTSQHEAVADIVANFFSNLDITDTILIVNSCAHGHAVAESDLDIAVLGKENIADSEIAEANRKWIEYSAVDSTILKYKSSDRYRHLHLDIINGVYTPSVIELGEPIDYFEVEIGNQVCYSVPMNSDGHYFKKLQQKWLPYYDESLRLERLKNIIDACCYDLDHIPFYIERELYFHALYILHKAFEEYLQALFIANKTYPLAYNKWIKYQVVDLLKKPELYPFLSPVLSIQNIESNEINDKAEMLRALLNDI
ncbi:MAG TPA: hypothetical protein VFW07_21495 [Parafilimonas sp.]|nr:hypothetical protein [Parafilimonas sp.]